MQVVEIIFIIILFFLQIYFCMEVIKKTKLISSFLPSKNLISIKKELVDEKKVVKEPYGNKPKDSKENIPTTSTTDTSSDSKDTATRYFDSLSHTIDDNGEETWFFDIHNQCDAEKAIIQLETAEDGNVIFKPHCTVGRLRQEKEVNEMVFMMLFAIIETPSIQDDEKATYTMPGKCKQTECGWIVTRKCVTKI